MRSYADHVVEIIFCLNQVKDTTNVYDNITRFSFYLNFWGIGVIIIPDRNVFHKLLVIYRVNLKKFIIIVVKVEITVNILNNRGDNAYD